MKPDKSGHGSDGNKVDFTLPSDPELDPHNQMQFSIILQTLMNNLFRRIINI